jgi:hypothetical protein
LVPSPARVGGRLAVPIDIEHLVASVRFDAVSKVAEAKATLRFKLDAQAGFPVFDLRQTIDEVVLDGRTLSADAVPHWDMGAGLDARMRVLDVAVDAGSRHELELSYHFGTPDATGGLPVGWSNGGVAWDLWMSDLEPGRYLEMWFPANLCHDAMTIELTVEVAGSDRPHRVLANGAVSEHSSGSRWSVRYPSTFTSLSPLLVLAPADEVSVRTTTAALAGRSLGVTVAGLHGAGDDLSAAMADLVAWLSYFCARYGPWAHGERLLAVLWGSPRGMEYDGATTASVAALEHEVFHSWFGRGVKPACASDGWMDEAMATWATASRRVEGGRYEVEELGLDEPPSLLYPAHPWSRHTPRSAYADGSRLLAGVAEMAGGAPQLRSALAEWYTSRAPGTGTTEELARHLGAWCGRDLGPWWERYVYGGERG